jgi:hypothetical protein
MTISRIRTPVPTKLPAAKLYLDDIEEVVRILKEAWARKPIDAHEENSQITTQFQIGDKVCDEIQDLPKIRKSTGEFTLNISRGRLPYGLEFEITHYATTWTHFGLTYDEAWAAFRKLDALLQPRRLRWRNLWHASPFWLIYLFGLSVTGLPLLLFYTLRILIPIGLAGALSFAWAILWIVVIVSRLARHSIVVFHYSWDHAARREELKTKIAIAGIPSILAFVLGLLAMYLKRKYWP